MAGTRCAVAPRNATERHGTPRNAAPARRIDKAPGVREPRGGRLGACRAGLAHSVAGPGSHVISWIGALSTFVGREQDAHKREEREEGDDASEQHVEVLQMNWMSPAETARHDMWGFATSGC